MAQNPSTGVGWKTANNFQLTQTPVTQCEGETGDKLIKCIEENAYSASDIIIPNYNFQPIYKDDKVDHYLVSDTNKSIHVLSHYMNDYNGIVHVLQADPGIISEQVNSTLQLLLNNTFSYFFVVTDPKLMVATARPDSVPTTIIKLEQGTGTRFLFFKVIFDMQGIFLPISIVIYFVGNKTCED